MDKEKQRLVAKVSKMSVKIVEKILLLPTLVWIYTPIIAGILIAMVHFVPIAFTSWWLFSFLGHPNWVLGAIVFRSETALVILIVIEFMLFFIGLVLFFWGLIYLANVKFKKQGLAIGGPYKFIRHPQHLGLILITLVISLYIPWSIDRYIRIGEILSWSLFALFLIISSELEERKLLKEYGDKYLDYRNNTGMFFPRIFEKIFRKKKEAHEIKYWKRFILIAVSYLCFLALIRLLVYLLGLPELPLIGWWYDYLNSAFWYINLIVLGLTILYFVVRLIRVRIFPTEAKSIEEKSVKEKPIEEKPA